MAEACLYTAAQTAPVQAALMPHGGGLPASRLREVVAGFSAALNRSARTLSWNAPAFGSDQRSSVPRRDLWLMDFIHFVNLFINAI